MARPAARECCQQMRSEAAISALYVLFFSTAVSSYLLLSGAVLDQAGPDYGLPTFLAAVFTASAATWGCMARKHGNQIATRRDFALAFPWAVANFLTWYLPMWALQFISAGQFVVLLQSRLLAKPLLAYVVIGEKRSGLQVVALGILLCGVLSIVIPDESQDVSALGIAISLTYVAISTVSMLYTQYACEKSSSKDAFSFATAVQIVLLSVVMSAAEGIAGPVSPRIRAGKYLVAYWLSCLAMDIATTLVVTKVSAVGVSLGAAITVPVTMMVEVLASGAAVDKHDTLAAMTVAGAVLGYAMATQEHQTVVTLQNEARAVLGHAGLDTVPPTVVGAA
eukprot:CAMPEP_0204364490 /NCGR_PEP_ID=MMETSP0469-20131031/41184_1 /ASSEMBLY_ACC=CAM_ASM_000384 /TAXON_ID=2969 /ORGANISM="Oxyrrhis marina" /LENGTH=336 /DNA_ID=CAMNT_0051353411 /DNA_START=1 /DNA_END=1011 /DNA_ORIENTATION=+